MVRNSAISAAVAVFFAVAPAHAETITAVSSTGAKPLNISAELSMPKTAARPAPVMIIVHGSSGVRPQREHAYARKFNELGVASVVIDSFKPRGVTTTVNDQGAVRDTDMVADVIAILKVVAKRPDIDATRIGLIGFSKGGTVATKVALRRYMRSAGDAKFALLLGLYPWCGELPFDVSSAGAPIVLMLGANDKYVGTESCREYAKKFQAAGGQLSLHVYDGAGHGWDVPGPTAWTEAKGQNPSKCFYEEVQPGKWIERGTKLVTFENGAPTANVSKVRAACGSLGVSGGYNAAATKRSWDDIAAATRAAFKL